MFLLTGLLVGVAGIARGQDSPAARETGSGGLPRITETGRSPETILPHLGADLADGWKSDDLVTLFDSTRVEVEPSGLTHRHHRRLVKVMSEAGGRQMASIRFDYDPASNLIEIRRVRIHRTDGRYEDIDPLLARDGFAPAHSIYWGARMKVIALPRLRPGDAVETITYKKGFLIAYLLEAGGEDERYIPPMRGHFYDSILFGDAHPFKIKHYEVILAREKPLQFATYNGEIYAAQSFTDSTLAYQWWSIDQDAVDYEPRQPGRSDFVPKVVMATVDDWPEKSRWFFEVNDPVFAWNEAIQEKVDELTEGLDSAEEKWAALTHWVADNIRYSGLSMGKGEGYTIHPSTMTWEERCGVCKDIAGMLVTFVRAAGYTSYPAMTMAGSRVEAVPADQFNHCVVAVRQDDGSYVMLDPTWVPRYRDVWSKAEGEQHYVIGSPEGEELTAIRSFEAHESPLHVELKTKIEKTGDLRGEIAMVGEGYLDGRLRRMLAGEHERDWDRAMARLLSAISPAVQITESEYADFRDYREPMRMRASFHIPGYAAITDSTCDFRSPSLRLLQGCGGFVRFIGLAPAPDRKHPALFWATSLVDIEEQLELPAKYEFPAEPADSDLDFASGSFLTTTETKGKRRTSHLRLALLKRTVPAAEWADLVAIADTLEAIAESMVAGRR